MKSRRRPVTIVMLKDTDGIKRGTVLTGRMADDWSIGDYCFVDRMGNRIWQVELGRFPEDDVQNWRILSPLEKLARCAAEEGADEW